MASVSALIISSVSGVSGAASTMKSDSASSSGSVSGPPTRSSISSPSERALVVRAAGGRARVAATPDRDDPAAERGRQRADRPADRAEPDDPDRHVAQLGALERLPRPLALELEELRAAAG